MTNGPTRVIQTFVDTCADCKHCSYYSGGVYECGLTTERILPDDRKTKLGDRCPLPYAGPPRPTKIIDPELRSEMEALVVQSEALVSKADDYGSVPIKDFAQLIKMVKARLK